MSTVSLKTSKKSAQVGGSLQSPFFIAYLDLLLLPVALLGFFLLHLPLLGFAVGGGAWIVQRFVGAKLTAKAQAAADARTIVGLLAGGAIGRGWFVAISILVCGLIERQVGLTAALLIVALYTAFFISRLVLRLMEKTNQ